MSRLTFLNFLGILIAIVSGYLLAVVSLPLEADMSAPLRTQFLPRLATFSAHFSSSRSFLPAVQKPLASLGFSSQQHRFNSTDKMTHDTITLKDAVAHRRTIYQLTDKSTIPDSKIQQIVTDAVKHVPSSFNSQSSRLVVLLKEEHNKFWDIVRDILKGIVPEDKWEHTGNRIAMFRAAYGSVSSYVMHITCQRSNVTLRSCSMKTQES